MDLHGEQAFRSSGIPIEGTTNKGDGDGGWTETSSLRGNVPPRAELIAPGYKRNPVGHCVSGSEPVRDQK